MFAGPRPAWLDEALRDSLDEVGAYPDADRAPRPRSPRGTARARDEVLATAGAAEAFTLVARLRPWRRPVVVHPQFTEPHAALEQAGHTVTEVVLPGRRFALDPARVPDDADLVVVGNPTNPTGVLHPADAIRALLRPGRLVVVDEAFMDAVPGEPESLAGDRAPGLVVIRSLTKHWGIPGVRAGYLLGDADAGRRAAPRARSPWSVSTPAAAAMVACATAEAAAEAEPPRATTIAAVARAPRAGPDRPRHPRTSRRSASFVLAEVGDGRARGAARRAGSPYAGPTRSPASTRPGSGSPSVRREPTTRLARTPCDTPGPATRDALG